MFSSSSSVVASVVGSSGTSEAVSVPSDMSVSAASYPGASGAGTAQIKKKLLLRDVNQCIQSKFCKVVTTYGTATGFFIDDEKGLLLSSFHLAGQTSKCIFDSELLNGAPTDFELVFLLIGSGYLSEEGYLTKAGMAAHAVQLMEKNIRKMSIAPNEEVFQYLITCHFGGFDEFRKTVFDLVKSDASARTEKLKKIGDPAKYLAWILPSLGYVKEEKDDKFAPTAKAALLKSKDDIVFQVENYNISWGMDDKFWPSVVKNYANKESFIFNLLRRLKGKQAKLKSETFEIHVDDEILLGEVYIPPDQQNNKQEILNNYALLDSIPIQITHFQDGTRFDPELKLINTGRQIKPLSEIGSLQIGEMVYFGGYPLTQEVYTFSRGIISSVFSQGHRNLLVIEAPIAPGNSGSPVFVQREGQIYWVGTITSEVAHITDEMLLLQKKVAQTEKGGITLAGIDYLGSLEELTNMVMKNLSTGKGKVVLIPSWEAIFEPSSSEALREIPLDFLVPKPKKKGLAKATGVVKLFEYIKRELLTSLSVRNMLDYIMENVPKAEDRQVIFHNFPSRKFSSPKRNYIGPIDPDTLQKDEKPSRISADRITAENEYLIPYIKHLYSYCYLISQDQFDNYGCRFKDDYIPTYQYFLITRKFHDDHVVEAKGMVQSADMKAELVARRRLDDIPVSTTLEEASLAELNDEVNGLQPLYSVALEYAQLSSKNDKAILYGLYFLTVKKYQITTHARDAGPATTSSAFFYSVVQKGDKSYMHHFEKEGEHKRSGWKVLSLPANIAADYDVVPQIFYSNKP